MLSINPEMMEITKLKLHHSNYHNGRAKEDCLVPRGYVKNYQKSHTRSNNKTMYNPHTSMNCTEKVQEGREDRKNKKKYQI